VTITVFACADSPTVHYRGVEAELIDGLCESPSKISDRIGEADQVVLLLHGHRYELADVQRALRSAEIDPLGTQILDVPAEISESDLEITVAGLRQRASAFAGSRPEHNKPTMPKKMSRRSVLRPPRPVYLAAPMVDHGICAADDGCQACVEICPQGAYRSQSGRIHFNKDLCVPCGRCVSGCPTEAISNPSTTPGMLAAQIRAIIGHDDAPVGIRFVCSRALAPPSPSGWHDIVVPCTGMVPGGWLLTALLMGAGSVTALTCADGGCPLELDAHSGAAIDFARAVLSAAELDLDSVPSEVGERIGEPVAREEFMAPFTYAGSVDVMLALGAISGVALDVEHGDANLGVVVIDPDSCTLCAQCAQACPTSAIQAGSEGTTVALSFDATSCTNCGQCTLVCPEIERGAIAVSGKVDLETLRAGRRTIIEGEVLVCESCGKPIAPSSLMDRIGELLGDEFDDTMAYLTRRCMDCRTLG